MKKMTMYVIVLTLPLLGIVGCKQGASAPADEAAADSVAAASVEEGRVEDSDEEMESQSGIYDAADVEKHWQNRPIKVTGEKSDIVALFGAFNKEWPTHEGNRIMHEADPASVPDDGFYEEGSIVDRKNGYVESSWFESEDLSVVSACVWNRKDGHNLFAVNMG